MYPIPPESHRHTRYYGILIAFVLMMLVVLFGGLRNVSERLSKGDSSTAQPAPLFGQPRVAVTPLALVTPSAQAAAAAAPASALPTPATSDVSPADLAAAPANYRSRSIRVPGKVFYVGKTDDGKTWIQITDPANHYINGSFAGTLPAGVTKGADVVVTGIGAGLTTITAANGSDYDEPYIDPVQSVELATATP